MAYEFGGHYERVLAHHVHNRHEQLDLERLLADETAEAQIFVVRAFILRFQMYLYLKAKDDRNE